MSLPHSNSTPKPPEWIEFRDLLADVLLDRIREGQTFTLSRWGDGEWYCMIRRRGKNSDGQRYYRPLGRAICNVLRDWSNHQDAYFLGMRYPDQKWLQDRIPNWLQQRKLDKIVWYNAGLVWHDLSIAGRISELIDAIREQPSIFIGPPHLRKMSNWIEWSSFVECPLIDAWSDIHRVRNESIAAVDRVGDGCLVSVSCGIAAKFLIHELRKVFGRRVFLVDSGSVFDPYCGRNTRRYHSKKQFRSVLRQCTKHLGQK